MAEFFHIFGTDTTINIDQIVDVEWHAVDGEALVHLTSGRTAAVDGSDYVNLRNRLSAVLPGPGPGPMPGPGPGPGPMPGP